MRRKIGVALMAALAVVAACQEGPEGVGGGELDPEMLDGLVRAQLEFGPRVPGTAAHAAALAWMVAWLEQRADEVEEIPFSWETTTGETLELTNVFARFRPEAAARVLLVAHWDSRPVSERSADPADRPLPLPGANDGASGVAVLLAIADALAARPPGIGVDLLLTDGEDWGHDPVTLETRIEDMLLGARHFADTRGATYRPLYGILLDLVGDQSPRFPREGHSVAYAPEVVDRVWSQADKLGHGDVFVDAPGQAITDDHVPLNEAGIRTIDVIDFDYPYWHTRQDTGDKVSARTLDVVGEVVLAVIRDQGGP